MKKIFYDIHVFYSRRNGFSIPFCSSSIDEETIINEAVKAGRLDETDADHVDSIDEITKEEFIEMGGLIVLQMKASEFFWHVVVKENSISVVKKNTNDCKKVKGSLSCYTTRKDAIAQANTKVLI